ITFPYSVNFSNACVFAISFFALCTTSFSFKKQILKENPILFILPIYFICLTFGIIYSDDKAYGIRIIERSLSFILLPLLLGTSQINFLPLYKKMGKLFVINTVAAALYCVIRNLLFFHTAKIDLSQFMDWEYSHKHLTDFINFHPTYCSIWILISILVLLFNFPAN